MPNLKLSRRDFLKISFRTIMTGVVGGLVGFMYSTLVEIEWIDIQHVNLTLPRLPKEFNGYRMVQISDIHFDDWMTPVKISKTVDMVNQLEPDMIAITGDFVSMNHEHNEKAIIEEFGRLTPKDKIIAVLGNHDHWTDADLVRNILKESGIINVSNDIFALWRGSAPLYFCGVDDYWERKDRLDYILEILPNRGCAILLAHEPDYVDTSALTGRFDLQISGHSHGGQVIIPFIGPPMVPLYAEKYPVGLYRVKEMFLYTNRGIGMIPPRVRFNCRPEITVFTLKSPQVPNEYLTF